MRIEEYINKSVKKRESLLKSSHTNAFRLFNGEADGIKGIAIDLYGEYVLFRVFNEKLLKDKSFIYDILANVKKYLSFKAKGILLKNCLKSSGENSKQSELRKSILLDGFFPPLDYTVNHLNIKMQVDLINSLNTGVFLDMRVVREKLVKYYSDIEYLLNLFCYTGAFSVHALLNNVRSVTNIDLSKSILKRAKYNYSLNNLKIDDRDFIYGSALNWIKIFIKKQKKFDLIIFDPPTFSRNKKETFSIVQNFSDYLKKIEKIVMKGGYVLSAINTFSINEKNYFNYHPAHWENVFYCNESSDYRSIEKPYLKVGLWKIS